KNHPQLRRIEKQAIEGEPALRGDNVDWMPWQTEGLAQGDELVVPGREHDAPVADRSGASQDRIGRDSREPLVNQVFVGLAAAQQRRIVRDRVAAPRLDKDEAYRGQL